MNKFYLRNEQKIQRNIIKYLTVTNIFLFI